MHPGGSKAISNALILLIHYTPTIGYIEIVGDSPADSLILKYQTLKDTQTNLQQRLQDLMEQVGVHFIST